MLSLLPMANKSNCPLISFMSISLAWVIQRMSHYDAEALAAQWTNCTITCKRPVSPTTNLR